MTAKLLAFRRRREARTNYKLRRKLILSELPLIIVNRSLKYIYVNVVIPKPNGDETVASANSKELIKRFNLVSGKNIPAAYLTGLLAGFKSKKAGVERAILNLGVAWSRRASIPFAAVQGMIDAGMDVPIGEDAKVDWGRIRGEHIASYAKYLKKNYEETYRRRFSRYIKKGLNPEELPTKFDKIRETILEEWGQNGN